MPDETERKFAVPVVPDPDRLGRGVEIRQGYLAVQGAVEVRVRLTPTEARLTVKAGSGLTRTEVELPIDPADGEALFAYTVGQRIEKMRHRIDLDGGVVAEIDRYAGDLEGLTTVEVEFPDAGAAAAFTPPSWFGRELTGDPRWSNAALARHGRPDGSGGADEP